MDNKKDTFTNEKLSKKFVSQFDLVNYAIRLAENMIKTGREPRVKIESQNRSMQILAEIVQDKDQLDELPPEPADHEEAYVSRTNFNDDKNDGFAAHKSFDKKKARRAFEE